MEMLGSRVALSNALSGAAADAVSTLALFPLDAVKIHMQADSSLTLGKALEETFGDNPLSVFKGITPKILQGVQQKFQYFYVYALLKQLYIGRTGKKVSVAADLTFGYFAALGGLFTTLPLEVTNTRVITSKRCKDGNKPGFWETFKDQLKNEGALSFYRTLTASAILCINPAISFSVFEMIKERVLKYRGSASDVLSTLDAFLIGIVSKAIATVLTFPFIRAKVLMSVWKKKQEALGHVDGPEPSMLETMEGVVQVEGFAGLYKGIEPQLVKAVTNAALMLAAKERIYEIVKTLILSKSELAK